MHQSSVSTGPLGPWNNGAFDFSVFKARIKARHCGVIFVVKSLLKAPAPRKQTIIWFNATRTSLIRRRYEKRVEDTSHIRSRYERYAVHTSRLRGILTATYVWRIRGMSYVSTAYLPRCFRMYKVCVTYVRRIGPATYVLRIFKCTHTCKNVAPRRTRSMRYVSRSMSYVCSHMYDIRVTYLSYLDMP